MSTQNGNGTSPVAKSVLAEITERLAAITSDQYRPPKGLTTDNLNFKSVEIIGEASDDIKRLVTLMSLIIEEQKPIVDQFLERKMKSVGEQLEKGGGLFALLSGKIDHGSPELAELEDKAEMIKNLHEIVNKIYFLELRRQHPATAGKSCGIDEHWHVFTFEPASKRESGLEGLLGGDEFDMSAIFAGNGMPPGLALLAALASDDSFGSSPFGRRRSSSPSRDFGLPPGFGRFRF